MSAGVMPSVLVTGAGRGLGRAVVQCFLNRRWEVLALVRKPRDVQALSKAGVFVIETDLATDLAESAIAEALHRRNRPLDLIINNAGNIIKSRGFENNRETDLTDLFQVHVVGTFRVVRASLPFLLQAPCPKIINISSRKGSLARTAAGDFGGIYSYPVAKAGLNMLSACLDAEFRPRGLRCFAVHPGGLKTDAAPADADTEPEAAARKLADWLETVNSDTPTGLHDLMLDCLIPW